MKQTAGVKVIKLVIGNKNYSSWSLRAWLYMRMSNIPFEEVRLSLLRAGWKTEILKYSGAGRVPILMDDGLVVWDSLAIVEYLAEKYPNSVGWPEDASARARARSVSSEMHAGFQHLRDELPQNVRMRRPLSEAQLSESCIGEVQRIDDIWRDCRLACGAASPWLFGSFSIADVMFAPVALRFVTYSIDVSVESRHFVTGVQSLEPIKEWCDEAAREPEALDFVDALKPVSETPSSTA